MLSYRHAFHAGNHADVLKHCVQILLLQYLAQKDTPYWYIDTHAGAGLYDLKSGFATKNSEFLSGISRLWQQKNCPDAIVDYLQIVEHYNPNGQLTCYPGSPLYAVKLVPPKGKLRLFERHPSDYPLLQQLFITAGMRIQTYSSDGLAGLKTLLPPPPKRALIFIDPPYENKHETTQILTALKEGLRRFANGIYAIWYPKLTHCSTSLPEKLKLLANKWLHIVLTVYASRTKQRGLYGSGLFIINPPWTLQRALDNTLPWLTAALQQDQGAYFLLESSEGQLPYSRISAN